MIVIIYLFGVRNYADTLCLTPVCVFGFYHLQCFTHLYVINVLGG